MCFLKNARKDRKSFPLNPKNRWIQKLLTVICFMIN